ncbi:MAG: hypothetical protein ACI9X0_000349 [Kiritimatiellia bacterium]|jgi:hypothetical protein
MRNIYFHIGFPKTATTFLQRGVFRDFNFLGNDSTVEGSRRLEHDIRNIICEDTADAWKTPRGKEIAQRLLDLSDRKSDVYYSSEYWLRGPATFFPANSKLKTPTSYTHMALEHLEAFQEHAWNTNGKVRVMVTFRKQSNWLGSQYAQISNRRKTADQSDFEELMKLFLADESPHGRSFLDYRGLHRQLVELLGKESVLFLPLEEVGTSLFWNRFEEWSGLEVPHQVEQTSSKTNVRRTAAGSWKTRPRNPVSGSKAVVVVDEYLRALGASFKTKSVIKKIEKRIYGEGEVVMTPEIRGLIEDVYAPSNRKLEEELECNLSGHGYF